MDVKLIHSLLIRRKRWGALIIATCFSEMRIWSRSRNARKEGSASTVNAKMEFSVAL